MPLNTIPFKSSGDPISVEVSFGYAQVGAYDLFLWDATGNEKLQLGEGVNTNQLPDVYQLPQPNSKNDGRLVDCIATVIAPNPIPGQRYRVDMIVRQGNTECGRESDEGAVDRKSISIRLAVKLVAS